MAKRIAIVFDNTLRPETTGLYCRRALGELIEVEHLLPTELGRVEADRFEAFIYVDDGLAYDHPAHLRPAAWWAIDTHLSFDRCLQRATQSDFVFAAQRDGAAMLQRSGVAATWLPLACDPILHRRQDVQKEFDWCFVGNLFPGRRLELTQQLQLQFPSGFVGQRYFEQMAETYSASRLVFNQSIRNDVNMRVFEALASGSLLITNDLADNGLSELFANGTHLATYRSQEELFEKFQYFLDHPQEREQIASQGLSDVLAMHTYRHRMEVLLSALLKSREIKVSGYNGVVPSKDTTYFEWDRPDVLAMIPTDAKRVADLGCGGGRLGQLLKSRQPVEVWGVERDPVAATHAAQSLDHVLNVNLDDDSWSLPTGDLDAIVCADVLEHLRSPERLLRRCAGWLALHGSLIVSLPNLQHHSVVSGLLEGNFTYEPAGLLDEDHLRLFTWREIEKLFFRTGFRILERRVVPGAGYADWNASGRPGEIHIAGLQINGLTAERAEEFFAYQYLIRAEPAPKPEYGLTSIIVVTHNQLHYTRQCLESLRFRTDEPFELIVVDNGSTDGSVDYLRAQPEITLISNPDNRGFPAAANQGMQYARGQQVLLLNNDTILTTGWLRRMLDALHSDPKIGMVGPLSNSVSGPQEIAVSYSDLASLDGFAWEQGRQHAGEYVDLERLVGFCLLIRREVVDTIGVLDERFGVGNFEDDDYCRRAQHAGYRTVVACDSFVHHFGSRTFFASGLDFGGILRENEQKFRDKWAAIEPLPQDGNLERPREFEEAEGGGLLLMPASRPRLSLCMIVRNNELTIRPCLESIRAWVDEMIVVDTGSTDATPQICEELGAQVFHWAWRDDFSAARNESLKHANGEWLFWMDSDDTISAKCGEQLRALADGPHRSNVFGYVVQVHCPGPDGDPHDVTAVDHVKLIRNRPELRFEHRIHEQILPAIRRAQGDVEFTDIYVLHSGSDHSAEGRKRKLERDFKLLHLDLAERPDHPFVLFNLGMTYADTKEHLEAVSWLIRCIEVSLPQESHVSKAYALLISSLMQLGDLKHAALACERGRGLFPDDKELTFRHAMVAHELGDLPESVRLYHEVLDVPTTERRFASMDVGLASFKARHNLAIVLEEQGLMDQAEVEWRAILIDQPGYAAAQAGLVECLLRRGEIGEAMTWIEGLRGDRRTLALGIRLAARVAEVRSDISTAIHELELGLQNCGEESGLLRELSRLLHASGNYSAALVKLERLTALSPENSSAWHNHGVVLAQLGRDDEAREAFAQAAALRTERSIVR
jgi:GT2 family glycosyltransferase/tetratricopeptide (TPR) repeat protein/2-polyprenyl-3-methyl-5-hydroxy-6-metoxy-1,4-benzoquinol methylase